MGPPRGGTGRRLPPGVEPEVPGPGQESVWDYPRPPVVVADARPVVVRFGGEVCRTTAALRVLETSHPPTWYLPVADFAPGALRPAAGRSLCEFKGQAAYLDLVAPDGRTAGAAAWTYPDPLPGYETLRDHVALYPEAADEVTVAGERVRAQPGSFYGGWVTDDVVGPFKGAPGSMGW
ncbi:DUF427 domain-containing protein [Aquipuribacter nitratireducens]|uniref:DUF427 domain-containing protein n=1 Tax=Aquipuribacter nitratireducens TaxID=650104 RepID=A0ABW0GPW9_9MICO